MRRWRFVVLAAVGIITPSCVLEGSAEAQPSPCLTNAEAPIAVYSALDPKGGLLWRAPRSAVFRGATADGLARMTVNGRDRSTFVFHRPVGELPVQRLRAELVVRLGAWQEVDYVAVGWVGDERFWQERVKHVRPAEVHRLTVAPETVAFQLTNGWRAAAGPPEQLRIVIKGTPGKEASVDIGDVRFHAGGEVGRYPIHSPGCRVTRESLARWLEAIEGRPAQLSPSTFLAQDVDALEVATALRDRREYRLTSLPAFVAETPGEVPAGALASTTSRFRWHSLDIVIPLIEALRTTGEEEYLALAIAEAERWLDRNFDRESDDLKYAWYDHGTANRAVALLLLWEEAVARRLGEPLLERLFYAIYAHAELLASPSFYARNQPLPFHNHAVFQDLGLLAFAQAIPEVAAETGWGELATERMLDQFRSLVSIDGASIENSWGYHLALADTCDHVATRLDAYSDAAAAAVMAEICQRMVRFSKVMRYPDGNAPAFGDTWRSPYKRSSSGRWEAPSTVGGEVFESSGYAAIWGPAAGSALQIDIFNSSLSLTHKHADFLSFTLWFDGLEWLIDPGFHSYTEDAHAGFAKSPAAHNTVLPCGRSFDPAVGVTTLRQVPNTGGASGVVAEYRPEPGLIVRRRFDVDIHGGLIVLEDELQGDCRGKASVVWFQLDDGVIAEPEGSGFRLRRRDSERPSLRLLPPPAADCSVHRAQVQPFLAGWYYPSFGESTGTTAIRCEVPAPQRRWRTELRLGAE